MRLKNLMINENVTLSCPGKSFLLGEYCVMQKGQAWLLNTTPRFQLTIKKSEQFSITGICKDSPAGKLALANLNELHGYAIKFIDPLRGIGGFGASSAQFLLLWIILNHPQNSHLMPNQMEPLLQDYWSCAWSGEGFRPSGADLIAQANGGLCFVDTHSATIKTFAWPFANLQMHLIHTQNKLATHTHLSNLKALVLDHLAQPLSTFLSTITERDEKNFISAIQNYYQALRNLKLVSEFTENILQTIDSEPYVLAYKGCGAMGADVILLITTKNSQENVKMLCEKLNLLYIASNDDLSTGVKIESDLEG